MSHAKVYSSHRCWVVFDSCWKVCYRPWIILGFCQIEQDIMWLAFFSPIIFIPMGPLGFQQSVPYMQLSDNKEHIYAILHSLQIMDHSSSWNRLGTSWNLLVGFECSSHLSISHCSHMVMAQRNSNNNVFLIFSAGTISSHVSFCCLLPWCDKVLHHLLKNLYSWICPSFRAQSFVWCPEGNS